MSNVTRFGPDPTVDQEVATKAYVDARATQTFARIVKKTDEIVNNSTVLQDDDELFVPLNINKTYSYRLVLMVNSSTSADFKYGFSIPSGATGLRSDGTVTSGSSAGLVDITVTDPISQLGETNRVTFVFGRIIMGGTPGNALVQWAQNTAEVLDTKLLQGSALVFWEET